MRNNKILITILLPAGVLADQTASAPTAGTAQNNPPVQSSAAAAGLDSDWFTRKMGPFSVAAGPATGGGFGASLTGDQAKPLPLLLSLA